MQEMSEFCCEAWSGTSRTLRTSEHEERRKAVSQRRCAVVTIFWLRHKETGCRLCVLIGTKGGKAQTSDHGVRTSLVVPRVCSVAQSCLPLCDPMDGNPPGSSVHGDSPGKNTRVGCMPSSRVASQPRDRTQVSHIAGGFFSV